MWIFLVCLLLFFFPPISYSAVLVQSIDCFCSSRRLTTSLLTSFALVRRSNWSCLLFLPVPLQSVDLLFSPSIVSALLDSRSASVHRLFMLFSSIIASFSPVSLSSRQFRSSPSIDSALLIDGFGQSYGNLHVETVSVYISRKNGESIQSLR